MSSQLNIQYLKGLGKITGDVGIEVEVESTNPLPDLCSLGWQTIPEYSLRNYGTEYISDHPWKVKEKSTKVKKLRDTLVNFNIVEDSPRTSVHVHTNISNKEPIKLVNSIVAYWLIENLLFKYCGENREGNLFCRRLRDTPAIVDRLKKNLKNPIVYKNNKGGQEASVYNLFQLSSSNNYKYSGLNIRPVNNRGSLEFRGMRGTIDDKLINTWSDELVNMVHNSDRYETPEQLMDEYYRNGPEHLLNSLFSPDYVKILKGYKNWDELIQENEHLLLDLCYSIDWSDLDKIIKKVFKNGQRKRKSVKSTEQYLTIDAINFNAATTVTTRTPLVEPIEYGVQRIQRSLRAQNNYLNILLAARQERVNTNQDHDAYDNLIHSAKQAIDGLEEELAILLGTNNGNETDQQPAQP